MMTKYSLHKCQARSGFTPQSKPSDKDPALPDKMLVREGDGNLPSDANSPLCESARADSDAP